MARFISAAMDRPITMKTSAGAGALAALLIVGGASAKDREFASLKQQIERTYHVKETHIPLLGVARFAAKSSSPFGGRTFDLAVFEDVPEHNGRANIEPPDGWSQVLRTEEGRERTLIFARPDENFIRILLLTEEPGEVTLIESEASAKDFLSHLPSANSGRLHSPE